MCGKEMNKSQSDRPNPHPHRKSSSRLEEARSPTPSITLRITQVGGIEPIDFIEAKGSKRHHLGNVVKYITRADHKGNRKQRLGESQVVLGAGDQPASKHLLG
jgi:hypothetical protein